MISVQSKRLADDVNYVYDRQILYTNKIQFQRSRIEDLTFRIAKAEKELVSLGCMPSKCTAALICFARNVGCLILMRGSNSRSRQTRGKRAW